MSDTKDPRFETTRDMLSKRYNGVMDPISDEAVQAVLDEALAGFVRSWED